jgi:hypothetical protein
MEKIIFVVGIAAIGILLYKAAKLNNTKPQNTKPHLGGGGLGDSGSGSSPDDDIDTIVPKI